MHAILQVSKMKVELHLVRAYNCLKYTLFILHFGVFNEMIKQELNVNVEFTF